MGLATVYGIVTQADGAIDVAASDAHRAEVRAGRVRKAAGTAAQRAGTTGLKLHIEDDESDEVRVLVIGLKGKIYVVEFWATWCGPCRATIPHLTKLQKQYKKDVTFIGVAILEEDQDEVGKFVEKMGDEMDYRVALDLVPEDGDGDEGAMHKTWMEPAYLQGIPAAFVINGDGVIAWIGHPGQIDDPLKKITGGTWDLVAEAKKIREAAAEKKKLEALFTKLRGLFGEFEKSSDPTDILKELDKAIVELPGPISRF